MYDIQSCFSKRKERNSKKRYNSNITQEKTISSNTFSQRNDDKSTESNQINLANQSQIKSFEGKSENLESIKSVIYGKDNKKNETKTKCQIKKYYIANFSELKKNKNQSGKISYISKNLIKFKSFTNDISGALSEEKKIRFFCFKEEATSRTEKISNFKQEEILTKKLKKVIL